MGITVDATIASKGQVTISREIRDRLGLEAGQEVEFVLGDDGSLEVRPKKPALERLANVRERVGGESPDVDVEVIRRESKRARGRAPDDDAA